MGIKDQKYLVSIQYSLEPPRARQADAWPKTQEENLKRLENAGRAMDRGLDYCTNCRGWWYIPNPC